MVRRLPHPPAAARSHSEEDVMPPPRSSPQATSEPAAEGDGSPPETTVARALRILDALGSYPTVSTLSQIARRTGLPKTTVHRLLAELELHEAVERAVAGYRLGVLSLSLANRGSHHDGLRRAVMPHLMDLYESVGHMVSLAVLQGFTVVYLETLHNRRLSQAVLSTQRHAPAHVTAAGKLLLAHTPALIDRYDVDVGLEPFTDHTITSIAVLATELARIRREGVAFNREEYVVGLIGMAGAILGPDGRPLAAVTVGGPHGQLDLMRVEPKLRAAVHSASAVLRRPRNRRIPPTVDR
jgi:DNA-binding IclR family transcriptional regulator